MKASIILELLQNVAILLAFTMLYENFWLKNKVSKTVVFKIVTGFIIGFIGIVIMFTPWTLMQGVIFDTRSVMLSVSGLFFGPIPTIIAMLITGIFRYVSGGDGALMGIAVVISAGTIGLLWRKFRPSWKEKNYYLELLAMGVIVHAVMLACTMFLPAEISLPTFKAIALPLIIIYSPTTMILGVLMLRQFTNQQNRMANEALFELERRYNELLKSMNILSVMIDNKGNITFCNKYLLNTTGYKEGELIGKNWFSTFIDKDDTEKVKEIFRTTIEDENITNHYENIIITKNGEKRFILWNNNFLRTVNGEIIGVASIGVDITERKNHEFVLKGKNEELQKAKEEVEESEKKHKLLSNKFETILDHIPGLVFYKDDKNNFIAANKYVAEAHKMSKADLVGKSLYDIYPKEDAEGYYQDDLEVIKSGIAKLNIEEKWQTELGEQWISTSKIPYVDNEGKSIGVIGMSFNITELKKTGEALKESEAKLRESNKTKDKFFSIIAHDLRSPFNSILGFSNILNENFDEYDTEEQKQFLGFIHQGIQNTYKLLENLLLWSRSQRGIIDFNPKKINLHLLSLETIELLNQSVESKSITLTNQISENFHVDADKDMLSTIMRNLISNAIKFTPQSGEISIKAHLVTNENEQNFTEITVKDSGVGISREIQSKLFDIGENTSTEGTEHEKGTGLGLILCDEFVEKHGGKIWVESEVGKGSEFIFTLPM